MTKKLFVVSFLTVLVSVGAAQGAPPTAPAYTHAQLQSMKKNAKTSAQYSALRDFYTQQAEHYRLQAAQKKLEWDRRSANPIAYGNKYPTAIHSAQYLYESDLQSEKASSVEAQRYEQLAKASSN